MFLLLFLVLGFSWGLLRGGNLRHLAHYQLHWSGLALLALLLQFIAFSSLGRQWLSFDPAAFHIASYVLLAVFAAANLRLPGFALLGVGLLSNLTVIWVNGGYMPTLAQHMAWLGISGEGTLNNSVLIQQDTPLWWLGDIFLLPLPVIGNVFSIGDLLLGVGAVLFAYHAVKPSRRVLANGGEP